MNALFPVLGFIALGLAGATLLYLLTRSVEKWYDRQSDKLQARQMIAQRGLAATYAALGVLAVAWLLALAGVWHMRLLFPVQLSLTSLTALLFFKGLLRGTRRKLALRERKRRAA
jgi:hypothetical protein